MERTKRFDTLWVARDGAKTETTDVIEIYAPTVRKRPDGGGPRGRESYHGHLLVCADMFQTVFGFAPKPGECILVRFSAERVEEQAEGDH